AATSPAPRAPRRTAPPPTRAPRSPTPPPAPPDRPRGAPGRWPGAGGRTRSWRRSREIVRRSRTRRASRRHRCTWDASHPLVTPSTSLRRSRGWGDTLVERFVYIDPSKTRDYLLNSRHSRGGSKARFFQSLGYSRLAWRRLELDLRNSHESGTMRSEVRTEHGDKYRLVSRITGPNGRSAIIVTVWIVREGESSARFGSAHPGKAR